MDIEIRFDDGTTEMLDEHTVCWVGQVITHTREDPIGQHRGETVWSRFARWAREQGVEFGKPRIWRTRTEVA